MCAPIYELPSNIGTRQDLHLFTAPLLEVSAKFRNLQTTIKKLQRKKIGREKSKLKKN